MQNSSKHALKKLKKPLKTADFCGFFDFFKGKIGQKTHFFTKNQAKQDICQNNKRTLQLNN